MTKKSKPISKSISRKTTKSTDAPKAAEAFVDDVFDFSDVPENDEAIPTQGEDDAPRTADKYEERYVAFIDILGFKELIASSAREESSISPSMIFNALDIRHQSIENNFSDLLGTERSCDSTVDFKVHSFSDCVVASCSRSPLGLGLLLFFCWQISSDWLSKGFLSRGGLTRGKLIHNTNEGGAALIFGPAFNQAYKLESEIADLPRLIFSREVREDHLAIKQDPAPENIRLKAVSIALVEQFADGPTGIDIFAHLRSGGFDASTQSYDGDANQYKLALASHLNDACDTPHFFRKIKWLVERFNNAIAKTRYADKHVDMV
jgi:hypothetical protein